MGPSDSKEIKIEIEAIETPAGLVPNLESIKKIAHALNLINDEVILNHEEIKKEVINKMESIENELKVFKKIFAEKVITSEILSLKLQKLEEKVEASFSDVNKRIENLSNEIKNFEKSMKIVIADSIHHFMRGAGIK
ncbi:MAG: hypothetical protein EAX96_11685 [Candidatus Lokiarchaeota archaeon]|nr:hypothetical protein [Candidatus Lokiarchaeota archaeon]